MMRVLLLELLCVLIPKLCAADDLLILALFARVTPADQSLCQIHSSNPS
jgi:hypothetical protein